MILSGWIIVAIIALIVGGIVSIINKERDDFGSAVFLVMLIGLGYILV